MRRGEIWWAELQDPAGSAPGFRRPVLVVQDDAFNESRIATVVCANITSNLALADAPGNVLLKKKDSGLPKTSAVNVSQIVTLDRLFLRGKVGSVPAVLIREVEAGLRLVLGL